jgi:hypothetical protein
MLIAHQLNLNVFSFFAANLGVGYLVNDESSIKR